MVHRAPLPGQRPRQGHTFHRSLASDKMNPACPASVLGRLSNHTSPKPIPGYSFRRIAAAGVGVGKESAAGRHLVGFRRAGTRQVAMWCDRKVSVLFEGGADFKGDFWVARFLGGGGAGGALKLRLRRDGVGLMRSCQVAG